MSISYHQNDRYPHQSEKVNEIKLGNEKNYDLNKQKTPNSQYRNPASIIHELKSHAHIIGDISEGKINFFNRRLKKCFPDLSRKEIIQILYFYSLLKIDKDHALPILKRAKIYFDNSEDLFKDIDEPEFRKLIIAKRYFDVLGFSINITHHTNYEGYLTNLKKWVIRKRTQSSAQKYVKKIIKPHLTDIEEESYIDVACDCVDLFSRSSNLILEVDSHEFHSINKNAINPKENLITQLKTYLLEKHGFNLVRLDVEKIKNEGRPYILNKIEPFIRYELELLQNDYIQEFYKNGGKCSYDIIGTNGERGPGFLDCLSPFIYTYQSKNPQHQDAMSTWMTSLLKNMRCPTRSADQYINYLSDLANLNQFNTTMKDRLF